MNLFAKLRLLFLASAAISLSAQAQSTIIHVEGPSFPASDMFSPPGSIDLDQDGNADFTFFGEPAICTMDVPTSFCSSSYYANSVNPHGLLHQDGGIAFLPANARIGPAEATNMLWAVGYAYLMRFWWSPREGTSGTDGPLTALDEGYLGLRLTMNDGNHYGWIRMRGTWVLDWAYESRPDTPIQAGAQPVPVPLVSPNDPRPGYLRLRAVAEPGKAYQIQTKPDMAARRWTNLNFILSASATNIDVDVSMTRQVQFFRVVEAD